MTRFTITVLEEPRRSVEGIDAESVLLGVGPNGHHLHAFEVIASGKTLWAARRVIPGGLATYWNRAVALACDRIREHIECPSLARFPLAEDGLMTIIAADAQAVRSSLLKARSDKRFVRKVEAKNVLYEWDDLP
jgi:hypothetical protein